MKNKWLIGLATGVLAVSLCAGMFGCANEPGGNGGGNGSGLTDEQIAQRAINVVKELARDIGDTTSANFEVVGQVPVEGVKYAVTWTATSDDVEDISQYVSIGAMDESTSMCTVTITKGVTAIDYTLTATVTVNQTSKQHSSTHHIPAAPREAAGTEQDPYTPSKVIELASAMTPKAKLEASDNPQRVWVTGKIVDCGTDQPSSNRVGFVCIVDEDEYSADLKQGDDGVLLILSINYDSTNLTEYSDLVKGNKITVSGFIMNYQKSGSTESQPEITYYGSEGIQCSYLEKADLSPAEKVERALGKVNGTLSFSETGDHDLPASTVDGVTFTWSTDDETYTIENNKLHVGSLPAESTTFDATVTANCDGVTSNNTKTVTITVLAEGDAPDYGTVNDPLTVSEAIALGNTIGSNTYLGGASTPTTVVVKGYVVAIDGWDSSHSDWTKVYIAETNDTGATQKVQLYRLGLDDTYLTEQADLVLGAEITVEGCMQYYNGNVEVCHNPATNVNAKAVAYTLPSHTHVWGSYTHTTGFNHTKVCSAANCEFNGEPQTEACTFDENVCEHCSYTAQQAEIVAAYNAMTSGNIPQGTFKLTGTVSNISKFKVGSSGDWQFYFTVDGTEFYVYYASHAVVTANQLSEGDTVTVVGSFTLYGTTKEINSGATITAWTSVNDSKTDAEKAQDVAESFTLSKTVFGTLNEEFELPTDNNYEAQVTWSVDGTTDLVTVTDNTLKIVKLAETEATQVTLKVTVTVGEDSAEHTYHITVNAEGTEPEPTAETVTFNETSVFGELTGSGYGTYNGDHTANGYTVTTSQVMRNTYVGYDVLQFQANAGVLALGGNFTAIKVTYLSTSKFSSAYRPVVTVGNVTLTANAVVGATDVSTGQQDSGKDVYSHTVTYTIEGNDIRCVTFDYTQSSGTFRAVEIVFTLADGAQPHVHSFGSYTEVDDDNHSRTCTVCQYVVTSAHRYLDNSDTTCEDCSHTRELDTSVWTLVTSVSDLHAGDEIVLIYGTAVNGGLNGKFLSYVTGVEFTDGKTTATLPDGAQPLTLGGSEGEWTFAIGSNILYLTSGTDNNKMASAASPSSGSKWSISITSAGVATIVSELSATCKLQCNDQSGQERFSNYKSGSQNDPSIYVKSN